MPCLQPPSTYTAPCGSQLAPGTAGGTIRLGPSQLLVQGVLGLVLVRLVVVRLVLVRLGREAQSVLWCACLCLADPVVIFSPGFGAAGCAVPLGLVGQCWAGTHHEHVVCCCLQLLLPRLRTPSVCLYRVYVVLGVSV